MLLAVRSKPVHLNQRQGNTLAALAGGAFRTGDIACPFKVLADISKIKQEMVEPRGIEPLTSSLRTTRSPN
tara:strand:- start:69 stop:281 length:213 start_codon:yes stop_codon:yes gene_type:complete